MLEWAVIFGLAAVCMTAVAFARAPKSLRIPLGMFNIFYFVTSVIGSVLVANPDFRALWMLTLPGLNAGWLNPGATPTYWLLVLGPFIVVNLAAISFRNSFRGAGIFVVRNLDFRASWFACASVGLALAGFCLYNLAIHGYLGVSLLSSENVGLYRENIQLRSQMARTLGDTHYGLVYMGIPAVCVLTLLRALETRQTSWWLLFLGLSAVLTFLYMSTLTKGNFIVFLLALAVTAYLVGKIRIRGTVIAGISGILLLTALDAMLTGTGLLEILATLSNIIFRMSSAIPFYVEVFPEQMPYVGIDYGLQWFGIGPKTPANLEVFNYMFPSLTWVQGAATAPAHIAAHAQAGPAWSVFTMMLTGIFIAFVGTIGRIARSSLSRALFVGGCIAAYYASQADLVGMFTHAYGLKWWLLALFGILFLEMAVRWFVSVSRQADLAAGLPEGK